MTASNMACVVMIACVGMVVMGYLAEMAMKDCLGDVVERENRANEDLVAY